ncbi:hypothetical protein E1193_18450 [Micromonospora sp. KC606]|uniref:hypothetical protein n=1 Tax=Micromonospora sp. KC606 TaxID=2530379 RepID=UPI00104F7C65|nr:hypothetical protein [Micromonospora sp. KC606]TDC79865.1 hypothetical protein E1193_18450 [Micromonospora sp. KC606]
MSGVVQAGWAPPSGPPEPTPRWGWPRWLLVVTALWAVLLGALTWWSVRTDPPTVREQRAIGEAAPVVERAVGELVAAIGDGAWALAATRYEPGCRVTPMADGAALIGGVTVFVAEGGERALLERVADRLPASWRAGVRAGSAGPRLRADAGEFVAVEGRVSGAGRIEFEADTGCRPVTQPYRAPSSPVGGPPLAAVAEAAQALGRSAPTPGGSLGAACPGGGRATTTLVTAGPAPVDLAGLRPLAALSAADPAALLDAPEVYAYRRGPLVVLADATGDELRLAASAPCP